MCTAWHGGAKGGQGDGTELFVSQAAFHTRNVVMLHISQQCQLSVKTKMCSIKSLHLTIYLHLTINSKIGIQDFSHQHMSVSDNDPPPLTNVDIFIFNWACISFMCSSLFEEVVQTVCLSVCVQTFFNFFFLRKCPVTIAGHLLRRF